MKFLSSIGLILFPLLSLGLVLAVSTASADVNVMAFQAWKTSRIDDARGNLEKLQQDKSAPLIISKETQKKSEAESVRAMSLKTSRTDQKVQQAQLSLEVAKELTVNDYFVLYLSQFKDNRDAFVEAAKKLSPDETADLMMSYEKHLAGNQDIDELLPSSATSGLGSQMPVSIK